MLAGLRQAWRWLLAGLCVLIALLPLPALPPADEPLVKVGHVLLALGAGYLVAGALERGLQRVSWERGRHRAGLVRLVVRLAVYAATAFAVLAAMGVNTTHLTLGGAAVTVIIGLAGQTLFGNVLSGAVLLIWNPFYMGDEISVVSWQMPVVSASYPHETSIAAHRVRVLDVNLLHTICVADDGQRMLIPNSIMLQAIVRNHSQSERCRLRVRAEAEASIPPQKLWERLQELARDLEAHEESMSGPVAAHIVDLSTSSTGMVVEGWVLSVHHLDEGRSRVLLRMAAMLESLRQPPEESGA